MESETLILGGSLAGMACAIELQRLGHQSLVLEKSYFPRKKLCGEFLGPDALRALNELGLLDEIRIVAMGPVAHTYFYNRKGRSVKIRHRWMDRRFPYGLALPRECLDTLLMQHAKALGVTVLEGHRVIDPIKFRNDHPALAQSFEVSAQASKTCEEIEKLQFFGRYLVDATGRIGKLQVDFQQSEPAIQGKQKLLKSRVGVQCHVRFPEKCPDRDLRMFLFPGGYGGLQPIGEQLANVCMLVDSSLAKRMHLPFLEFIRQTIGQNPAAWDMLKTAERESHFCTTGDVHLAGESQNRVEQQDGGGYLRVGDACLTVDPFTGSGMAHALETGRMAAQSIHSARRQSWTDDQMQAHYRRNYHRRFHHRLKWMSYVRPFLENGPAQDWIWPFLPPLLPGLTRWLR